MHAQERMKEVLEERKKEAQERLGSSPSSNLLRACLQSRITVPVPDYAPLFHSRLVALLQREATPLTIASWVTKSFNPRPLWSM